jgi:Flp pilus assembly protein TadG
MTSKSGTGDRGKRGWSSGNAAVEFAITAPLLVLLALGAADYGTMMAQSSGLAAYARAGAEYAAGQIAQGNSFPTASTIQTTLNFPSGVTVSSFTIPAPYCTTSCTTYPYCTCADATTPGSLPSCPGIGDANPCVAKTDPRVLQYVSITTSQSFSPMISYSGFATFPSSLSSTTVFRVR